MELCGTHLKPPQPSQNLVELCGTHLKPPQPSQNLVEPWYNAHGTLENLVEPSKNLKPEQPRKPGETHPGESNHSAVLAELGGTLVRAGTR